MSYNDEQVRERVRRRRKHSFSTTMAFILGVPIGLGLLAVVDYTPLHKTELARYVSHPVEKVCVMLFACASAALLTKFIMFWYERLAFLIEFIPTWDGEARPISHAGVMIDDVQNRSGWLQKTFLGQRILNVLEFVENRKTANDLDDHLRGLQDNDDIALEGSYSLIRFITWAIPILGFLGTVLGITGAIAGVTPQVLESDLRQVTRGLATAFDTTAVALALTMVVMFCNFMVERLEQGLLEKVNLYADEQLAHRFERTGADSGEFVEALRKNSEVLMTTVEHLIQRQVNLWSLSLQEAQREWQETGHMQQSKISAGLEDAMNRTTEAHSDRLAQQQQASSQGTSEVVEQLQQLTSTINRSTDQQQENLARLLDRVQQQTQLLAKLSDNGGQLLQLQEVMQQNLNTLAGAGAFEEAVNSLTAAIHLLTTKTNPGGMPKPSLHRRPGAAA